MGWRPSHRRSNVYGLSSSHRRLFRPAAACDQRRCILLRTATLLPVAFILGLGVFSEQRSEPWSVAITLKHIAAALHCEAARTVGLAPAMRGEPGYYPRHDRDQDGITCEPWTR